MTQKVQSRDGFLSHLRVFGLPAYPHHPNPFPAPDGDCGPCRTRYAHRIQPNLLGCSFPERRYRRIRGGSRLAHVLHPNHPPDAKPDARILNPTWPEARGNGKRLETSVPIVIHWPMYGASVTPGRTIGSRFYVTRIILEHHR
jgi:hypothetical protein